MSNVDMIDSYNVFILQHAERLPSQLREALIKNGYPTYVTSEVSTIAPALKKLERPMLLVLCEGTRDGSFENTKELISRKELHSYPLILVGTEVNSYEQILNKHFSLAVTLDVPAQNAQILESVAYIVRDYPVSKLPPSEPATEPIAASEEIETKAEPATEPEIPIVEHNAYKQIEGIPELFFEKLSSIRIPKMGMGGAQYPKGMDEDRVRQQNLFPQNSVLHDKARDVCADVGKWGRLHLYRTSFLTQAILNTLGVSEEVREQAKAAVFLFSLSYAGDNPDLLRRGYFDRRHSSFRRDMCSKVKDSAMTTALELGAPEVANLIATLGRFIGREEQVTDLPVAVAASAIMASDITDRVCFQSGHWNPRQAYLFLKKIKTAQLLDMHPSVLCCVVRMLTEALAAHPHALILGKHLKHNPELQKAAKIWREQRIGQDEKRVALVNLMPGMKLSRPVHTFDGLQVLSGDLTLDQDLIWRLWQLSMVRPLNGPVVVFSKN